MTLAGETHHSTYDVYIVVPERPPLLAQAATSAGVVAAAVFVATVFVGADAMSRATGVPSFIADVIVALCLLTMIVALLFTTYRVRR